MEQATKLENSENENKKQVTHNTNFSELLFTTIFFVVFIKTMVTIISIDGICLGISSKQKKVKNKNEQWQQCLRILTSLLFTVCIRFSSNSYGSISTPNYSFLWSDSATPFCQYLQFYNPMCWISQFPLCTTVAKFLSEFGYVLSHFLHILGPLFFSPCSLHVLLSSAHFNLLCVTVSLLQKPPQGIYIIIIGKAFLFVVHVCLCLASKILSHQCEGIAEISNWFFIIVV